MIVSREAVSMRQMKPRMFVLAGIAVAAVATTTAVIASSSNHDFAAGGFERTNVPESRTSFAAQMTPKGPSGHLNSTAPNGDLIERYDVVCLAVNAAGDV